MTGAAMGVARTGNVASNRKARPAGASPVRILLSAAPGVMAEWQMPLERELELADIDALVATAAPPATVDYLVCAPDTPLRDFAPFTRCKAVISMWAGVETLVKNPTLTIPLSRMVDPDLTQGMTEWVVSHVMRHHLGIDAHIVNPNRQWVERHPPLARDRTVVIFGVGALGMAVAHMLLQLGFRVVGWGRTPRENTEGMIFLHGEEGLEQALRMAGIAVLLLPLTAATENLMDARRLALMPRGAFVINAGRGPLIDDDALIDALDRGHIAHATLDVFRKEPLPDNHPFWAHPKVTVTPHIASATRPASAAKVVAEEIRRSEAGKALTYLVDRTRGY